MPVQKSAFKNAKALYLEAKVDIGKHSRRIDTAKRTFTLILAPKAYIIYARLI